MKIYFTASARGKKEYGETYKKIYDSVKSMGHTHTDDFIFRVDEEALYQGSHAEQVKLYEQTIKNIKASDIVVLEVSVHSLSMGYVLQRVLDAGKPVIALYTKHHEPYFALGIENDKLQVLEYAEDNLIDTLKASIDYAKDQIDTRFNFFISPRIGAYLDHVFKTRRIPRAVYLRQLIEEDMVRDKKYGTS